LGLFEVPIRKTFYEAVDYMTVLPWFIRTTKAAEAESEINLAISIGFPGRSVCRRRAQGNRAHRRRHPARIAAAHIDKI